MIDNDLRRSFEFFKNPVMAGRAAVARPFDNGQVLGLHVLRAIILALFQYFLAPRLQVNSEAVGLTQEEQQLMQALQASMDYYYSSPLLIALANLVFSLLFTTLLWQVGRAIAQSELSWNVAQSAFLRFLYVGLGIYAVFVLFYALTSWQLIVLIANLAMIYLFVVFLFVIKGALELRSAWQSLLVTFLAGMAMIGVFWVFSFLLRLVF